LNTVVAERARSVSITHLSVTAPVLSGEVPVPCVQRETLRVALPQDGEVEADVCFLDPLEESEGVDMYVIAGGCWEYAAHYSIEREGDRFILVEWDCAGSLADCVYAGEGLARTVHFAFRDRREFLEGLRRLLEGLLAGRRAEKLKVEVFKYQEGC
jgi:hypothetical protein